MSECWPIVRVSGRMLSAGQLLVYMSDLPSDMVPVIIHHITSPLTAQVSRVCIDTTHPSLCLPSNTTTFPSTSPKSPKSSLHGFKIRTRALMSARRLSPAKICDGNGTWRRRICRALQKIWFKVKLMWFVRLWAHEADIKATRRSVYGLCLQCLSFKYFEKLSSEN
jgi:hypothetical protein